MRAPLTMVTIALSLTLTVTAAAQMPGGAFDRLVPGDQKLARALHDAQRRDLMPGSRLTLDQIAMKKGSEGWGNVFKDMKSQGLVTAKTLGHVVNRSATRSEAAGRGVANDVARGGARDASASHASSLAGASASPGGGFGGSYGHDK